jgi:hypothetical protein
MATALLIGITGSLGCIALGLGVLVLDKPPPPSCQLLKTRCAIWGVKKKVMQEIKGKTVERMQKFVLGCLMLVAISLPLNSPVTGYDGLDSDTQSVYECPRDGMEIAWAVRFMCEWTYAGDDGCERVCADVYAQHQ